MKKNIPFLTIAAVIISLTISCGSKKEEKSETAEDDTYEIAEPKKPSSEELIAQGKTLVERSDCRTCHHEKNMIIGPAHGEVAKRYDFTEENVKKLASKIINGGSGEWGDVMMNPHPDVSQTDAEKMAYYVLSLDGEEPK